LACFNCDTNELIDGPAITALVCTIGLIAFVSGFLWSLITGPAADSKQHAKHYLRDQIT